MQQHIGVIGTGNMGLGMVQALLRAGCTVTVRDIDPHAAALARECGAQIAATARELAVASDVVLVVVVDAAQIDAALFSESEPASAGWRPGTPILLCSTIGPADAESLAQRIQAAGGIAIDAPISGGPARAAAGQLALMLAGPSAVLDQLDPLLAVLSHKRFRISAQPGDGARMKLINNLLAGIHLAAGAQALALGEAMGLDAALMLEVIGASSGQSWIVGDRMPRAIAGDFAPRAHLRILKKDLTLAMEMAAARQADLPIGQQALTQFMRGIAAGLAEEDDSALLKVARQGYVRHAR